MSNTPTILQNPLTNKDTAFTQEEASKIWPDWPPACRRGNARTTGHACLPPVFIL